MNQMCPGILTFWGQIAIYRKQNPAYMGPLNPLTFVDISTKCQISHILPEQKYYSGFKNKKKKYVQLIYLLYYYYIY